MTKVEIDSLNQTIRQGDMKEIASRIRCTMCGKTFTEFDLMLGENLYDIFVGYGSKYDCTRIQFNFCTKCFDKVLDNIIPECYFDPIVDSDYMDHCIGSDNHIHENWGFGGNNQDKDKTRVIVCGGRDFTDYKYLSQTLDEYLQQYKNVEIVSGHAKGADTFGEKYAEEHGIPCSVFPANWKDNGRIAGLIRNSKMIDYAMDGKPLVIAFWDGKSHGTKDTIRKAGIKNIPCIIAGYNGYDINSMIENAIEGCSGCLMWVAYELGYYDSFHKIPESKIINDEAKFYYLRGYQETKKENFYNRHLEKFGFRSTSELILENARSTMIGEKGCNAWGDNEENE